MLINADVKSLEVVTAAYLSQDRILCSEVRDGVDFHELNQRRFNLPSRTIAKIFKFKLIYGAQAWGYAHDSDFIDVSTDQTFWQKVIDEYYRKYSGMRGWHNTLIQDAIKLGVYKSPTGRIYSYPAQDVAVRNWFWRPKILNYPVQGLGADLVMLARISFWNRLKSLNYWEFVKLCSSVHDSIVVDVDNSKELCYTISKMLKECVEEVPTLFKKHFNLEFNLPLSAEVKIGKDLKNMEVYRFAGNY